MHTCRPSGSEIPWQKSERGWWTWVSVLLLCAPVASVVCNVKFFFKHQSSGFSQHFRSQVFHTKKTVPASSTSLRKALHWLTEHPVYETFQRGRMDTNSMHDVFFHICNSKTIRDKLARDLFWDRPARASKYWAIGYVIYNRFRVTMV